MNNKLEEMNKKLDDKISELLLKTFRVREEREKRLNSNNEIPKNYKLKDSYTTDNLYIGIMHDYFIPNSKSYYESMLYLFEKINTTYYEELGTDLYGLSEDKVDIYREIFTGTKFYPYDDSKYVFERRKVKIISPLNNYLNKEKIKKEDILKIFDNINSYKEDLDINNKVYKKVK